MNILERWKIAKIGEKAISRHGWTFTKHYEENFINDMYFAEIPNRGLFDDWPEPKKSCSKTVLNPSFSEGSYLHSQTEYVPIEFFRGKKFSKVIFEWEE